jgi:hypothetical protein
MGMMVMIAVGTPVAPAGERVSQSTNKVANSNAPPKNNAPRMTQGSRIHRLKERLSTNSF